jgi:PAS domain S-box-containing protein
MIKDKKHYNILVVEDNPGDFLIVEDFLLDQVQDPLIINTVNFRETAEKLRVAQEPFDVIFLDLSLPDKDGRLLITEMLALASSCPIIILTGYTDVDFSIQSIGQGISDYIVKDELNAAILYKSMIYAIERKRTISQLKESEKRYSDLFHLSPQPMCLYESGTFRFCKVNKAAIDHFGYNESEFLNVTLIDLVPIEERPAVINTIVKQARVLNNTYKAKSKVFKKSGDIIEVETFSTPLIIDNKEFTFLIAIDVTEKNLHEAALTRAIIKTQEDERYEIGGELHDNVCQLLASSMMSLGMIRSSLDNKNLQWFERCNESISMASTEIRNLSHRLAPAFFQEATLEEAFINLFNTFNIGDQYEIKLHIDASLHKHKISQELQLNLYRVLQEQLRNIFKYAAASIVEVDLIVYNNKLKMMVTDNGVGFDVDEVKAGIGLANMKRRAELFSGRFEIDSAVGKGCSIIIDIPLETACAEIVAA